MRKNSSLTSLYYLSSFSLWSYLSGKGHTWSSTITASSLLLCLSSRLINVILVCFGINLSNYDRPEQTRLVETLPRWQSRGSRGVWIGRQGEGPSVHFFMWEGGLQWEKYQPHYGVDLSLPSLSMRGRGLSESTKGKRHNNGRGMTRGMDGWKRGEGNTTQRQKEGLKSFPIGNEQREAKEISDEEPR